MFDELSFNQKKWLVDNREMLTNQITSVVTGLVTTAVGGLCMVIFNQHNYEFKRLVRNEKNEDFIVLEDIDYFSELRDKLRISSLTEDEKLVLDELCGKTKEEKKRKKRKK